MADLSTIGRLYQMSNSVGQAVIVRLNLNWRCVFGLHMHVSVTFEGTDDMMTFTKISTTGLLDTRYRFRIIIVM